MDAKRPRAGALPWFVELFSRFLHRARQELRAGVGLVELLGDVLRNADLLREGGVVRRRRHRAGLLLGRRRHQPPPSFAASGQRIAAARNAKPRPSGCGTCGIVTLNVAIRNSTMATTRKIIGIMRAPFRKALHWSTTSK